VINEIEPWREEDNQDNESNSIDGFNDQPLTDMYSEPHSPAKIEVTKAALLKPRGRDRANTEELTI
jgi:hypothetical protein